MTRCLEKSNLCSHATRETTSRYNIYIRVRSPHAEGLSVGFPIKHIQEGSLLLIKSMQHLRFCEMLRYTVAPTEDNYVSYPE